MSIFLATFAVQTLYHGQLLHYALVSGASVYCFNHSCIFMPQEIRDLCAGLAAFLSLRGKSGSEIVWRIASDAQTFECSLPHSLRAGITPRLFPAKDESAFFARCHQNGFKGNPKLEILWPLLRTLCIDANTVFYPEKARDTNAALQLQLFLSQCSEEELQLLLPICEAIISSYRSALPKEKK